MPAGTEHVITAPLSLAIQRMPAAVVAGSSDVELQRHGRSPAWHWEAARGGGQVVLSALTATSTRLDVTADPHTPASVADALTVELCGALERTWAPPTPPSARTSMGRRSKIALAAAALLVPVLAVTGLRVLAPPKALDVAAAVEQFRQQDATTATVPGGQAAPRNGASAKSPRTPETRPARAGVGRSTGDGAATQRQVATAQPGARQDQAATNEASQPAEGNAGGRPAQKSAPEQQQSGPSGIPEEGVYRYATKGYESIDRPSSRHDYPSETAMSIRHSDCGFSGRWQPLENRWDEMDVCRRGDTSFLPRLATHREFYGQANDSDYECSADNYAYRPEPGATWTGFCSDGPAKMQIRGRALGIEPVRVGARTVDTVRYALQARISGGDAEGTWTAERWVDPDTGLLVRVEAQTNATSDSSVGEVHYREEVSLRLLSMTPQR